MSSIARALGWSFFLVSVVGFVRDEIQHDKTRFVDLIDAGHAGWGGIHAGSRDAVAAVVRSTLEQSGLADGIATLLALPACPIAMVVGILLLWLTASGSGSEVRPISIDTGRAAAPNSRSLELGDDAPAERRGPVSEASADAVTPGTELKTALKSTRTSFVGVAIFSGMVNILMLTGSFFMLEVYDRVLPSRSTATLIGLSLLALVLFIAQGGIDLIRTRMLTRIGGVLDETVSGRVHDAIVRLPLRTATRSDGLLPLRDLDTIRGFLGGLGPTALFDLPWVPLYVAIIYLFHPMLGIVAILGALLLVGLTLLTEIFTSSAARKAAELAAQRMGVAEASRRNAEVVAAMGMGGAMRRRWHKLHRGFVVSQTRASDVALGFGAFSKVLRMTLQSGVLALGAYLVIKQEASGGIIIAGSILVSRALAPIELAIGNWRGFVAARMSWRRLNQLLKLLPAEPEPLQLPTPASSLSIEGLSGGAPGEQRLIVHDISFKLVAGDGVAIMGPSASGKSSLARLVVGVWRPARGAVRLDGAAIDQWSTEELGRSIGYLPQDVELFAGTVAENIARFDPEATSEMIVAAAQAAGAHALIVGLEDGYDTQIGEHGKSLSAGQQQRVALARALYGDPFLIVLDEPNSNLDAEGEGALTEAIIKARQRGAIVVVVAHRPSALAGLGHVLAIYKGRLQAFGSKEEVLPKILRPAGPSPQSPAPVAPGQGVPRVASATGRS